MQATCFELLTFTKIESQFWPCLAYFYAWWITFRIYKIQTWNFVHRPSSGRHTQHTNQNAAPCFIKKTMVPLETYVFSTKTTFLVETVTLLMRTKVRLYGPKPSKYIRTRSNYHRMVHQDASYVFSTNIPACSTVALQPSSIC